MKKKILKVTGLAAFAALMVYNVQVFETRGTSNVSLLSLVKLAVAQTEGGGGTTCCPHTGSICSTTKKDYSDYWNKGNGPC